MPNDSTPTPSRGVPVTLDRERRLRYTFKTRREMLTEVGGEEALSNLKGDNLVTVLWYGLKHEDPDLTKEQLEEMVDMENIQDTLNAMLRAMGYKGKAVARVEDGENP